MRAGAGRHPAVRSRTGPGDRDTLIRQPLYLAQSLPMPVSSPSKMKLRRGIAEVALIFIGITLALLFDNWNEARKDRILEEQLFAALRADLLETRADLVTDIEAADRRVKNTRSLIKVIASDDPPRNAGKDLLWRQIGTTRLYKKDFAYRALVAQGLESISNWQILKATTDLYELQFSRVASAEESAFSLERRFLEQLFPHVVVPAGTLETLVAEPGRGPILLTVPLEVIDWQAMHADRELVHWLMELLERTLAALAFYQQALSQLDEIIEMIDEEIGSSEQHVE